MRLLILASVLALAACMPQAPQQQGQQQANGAVTATPVGNQSGKPGVEAPAEATPAIDREFMIGRWGDNGDCSKDIVINADNSFTSYTGGEGQWTLSGNTLRLEGKNGGYDLRLELINHDTLRITNPDGSVGASQRCG